jgi:pimeloyl-ACP methyl ester carboxylesterase
MAELDRSGVKIYYEDHGKGPAILLSHGYSATTGMWSGQIEAFKDKYRVIVWDMRGHGRSDSPSDGGLYSEAHTVADMQAVLDACGVKRAVVGGLSLGGYMSLAFHRVHADMTRALMLFDTGPGFKNEAARLAWNQRAHERALALEAEGFAALGKSDEVMMSRHQTPLGLAGAARGMLAQEGPGVILSLPHVRVPTLVLVGANDTPFLGASDYMAAKIPGARKVVIPDAGHASNLHQPAAFNRAMADFVGGLPA